MSETDDPPYHDTSIGQIDEPTEEEREAIREQFDKITIPTGKLNHPGKHHINPTGNDRDRLCKNRNVKPAEKYRTADLVAFPGDHFDPCSHCVAEWRRRRESE